MIRPQVQFNLQNAKTYFREHLCVGDYYSQGQTIPGEWFGQGASKLALVGPVRESAFLALCEGNHPATGRRLTLRMNSVRRQRGKEALNRRVFYDFTISPPKSASIVALYQDPRIADLHDRAVRLAMAELEKFAETRVRLAGKNEDRVTGNLVGAYFRHDTSRELDPHLHTHCVVFNATFDTQEGRWKALQAQGMYHVVRFAQEYYRHELCKGLRSLGYEIHFKVRSFEILGVPESLIARFSKRHQQIDDETKVWIERHGLKGDINALRNRVAHGNRRRKLKDSTANRLRNHWTQQMPPSEQRALERFRSLSQRALEKPDLKVVLDWAEEHVFERRATVADYELMSAALAKGQGQHFDLAELQQVIDGRGYVREAGTRRLTSREMLGRELDLVLAAKEGRFRHDALAPAYEPQAKLSAEQMTAVRQILASRDFITLFRGVAGSGKSFALKEVERGLMAAGRPVLVLAPQRQQVLDLQHDGLPAQTVAQILTTKQIPRNSTLILDEAGQIGGRDLHALVALVRAAKGRIILSGDTRQHGAVAASDAMRAIEKHACPNPAEIRTIRRQDPTLGHSGAERQFIRGYRGAVRAAAGGKASESFDRLDRMGCIRELAPSERRSALASEYIAAQQRGERVLVVAQTWDEVAAVNDSIRNNLRSAGKIGEGQPLKAFRALDLDSAQQRDARSYGPDQSALFIRSYGRFAKGDLCEIQGANERGVIVVKNGRSSTVSFRYAGRMLVAKPAVMEIAPGDRLQLKFNGRSVEGLPISNGELVSVRQFGPDGTLVVENDAGATKTLAAHQRLFNRGHAVTSYSSQGKTVDTVLVADSGCRAATSSNQWYVAISRARKKVIVFTEDKEQLRAMVQKTGDRELAIDLTPADASGLKRTEGQSQAPSRAAPRPVIWGQHWMRQAAASASESENIRGGSTHCL